MTLTAVPLARPGFLTAQKAVTLHHYLHKPVDARCSPIAYGVNLKAFSPEGMDAGYLIFGRPEATRCGTWYGSVDDVLAGRCECTRWQVLNLARVFVWPVYQGEDARHLRHVLPGFTDRRGMWRSTLASTAINVALERVVVDYLIERPPCFPDEPYELLYCLSYCDTRVHRGTLYRAAGFELYRTNENGIQTWRKKLRPLTRGEHARVLTACEQSMRSQRYRSMRAASEWKQAQLPMEAA